MDNFDENDEKLLIEINICPEVLYSEINPLQKDLSESLENVFINEKDNSKLILQSKNPYSKLAFIKSLKDNLICLGYLEETVDTLNYFHEDLINSTITAISTSVAPKKRKILSRKKSHDKTNIVGDRELFEVCVKFILIYKL